MNKNFLFVLGVLASSIISSSIFADTIQLEFKYKKKPPLSGIIYSVEPENTNVISGEVDQKNKEFVERVVVVSPKSELVFKNSDTVDHNIFANDISDANVRFDVGLMPVGSQVNLPVDWTSDTFVRIG